MTRLAFLFLFCFICAFLEADNVSDRLKSLVEYSPSDSYNFEFSLYTKSAKINCSLCGSVEGKKHNIVVKFPDHVLKFDKNCASTALLDDKPLNHDNWFDDINNFPCNYFMIAMPFLNWPVLSSEKTAKCGRKVFRIELKSQISQIDTVELFIDEHFNTIVEINACVNKKIVSKFVTNSFKKFNKRLWWIKSAVFGVNPNTCTMIVTSLSCN